MENRDSPILQVQDLIISFSHSGNWQEVVHSLSFSLEKGETLGLVGESGSGKSVTALTILGLLGSSSQVHGKILFKNQNLVSLADKDFRKIRGAQISMIFQEPMTSLNPVLTCGDQISEVLQVHLKMNRKDSKNESIRLLGEVELPRPESIYYSYPHQLSGGQRQRVMIAMALASNPEILIADEPTTALDVTVQKTIMDLLIRIKNTRNMSMIFISHDLGLVSQVADRVMVLFKGNCVETGKTHEIFTQPKHPYTRGLLACRPGRNIGLSRLPVMSDFMSLGKDGSMTELVGSIDTLQEKFKKDPLQDRIRRESLYSHEPLLSVKNLSKHFKEVKAVNNVSFKVFPGETLGLVGESGCGKSTLGRSILRLIEPSQGSVEYRGEDILKFSQRKMRETRKNLQIIFQDPYSSLNPRQTIGETLMEPLKIFNMGLSGTERKNKALEILEKVQLLPEHFYRYPYEFSGGQRQRIGIARSLMLKPEFIICDESVSALDVSIQAQIINLLISLREEFKLTLIFISHDLSVVRFISDRILVMNKGVFEEEGNPDEIYFNPQSAYTKRLIEAIPKTI